MIRWLALLSVVLLGGCALLSTPPASISASSAQLASAPFALNGRVSINHQGKRHSAGLRWMHREKSDEILLLTPLGQTAARIYRDDLNATLDSDGKRHQADDVETLMQQVLGWHLPLSGLHQWVLGLPAANSSAQIERNENGRISLLTQDGWEVRYLRYADTLPSRLQLTREDLQVQLLIDEWDWNPQ